MKEKLEDMTQKYNVCPNYSSLLLVYGVCVCVNVRVGVCALLLADGINSKLHVRARVFTMRSQVYARSTLWG